MVMAVEAKQQTTISNLPERAQEERAITNVRFLEIPADRETLFSEELRTTTTPVPIRYLNNYEENPSGERLARSTTPRPRLLEIVKAIRKYLFLNSPQGERTRANSRNVLAESLNFLQNRNAPLNYFHSGEKTMNGDVEIAALRQGGNTPVPLLYSSDGLKVVIDSKSKVTQTEPDDTTTKSVAKVTPNSTIQVKVEPVVAENFIRESQ
jgi:hypothetical protein